MKSVHQSTCTHNPDKLILAWNLQKKSQRNRADFEKHKMTLLAPEVLIPAQTVASAKELNRYTRKNAAAFPLHPICPVRGLVWMEGCKEPDAIVAWEESRIPASHLPEGVLEKF